MIPGFTSTGSKRPDIMYGEGGDGPRRMTRADGCRVWDEDGREYLDTTMALGAVSLGYAHPAVNAAVCEAVDQGVVGPLAPVLEGEVADRLGAVWPGMEAIRFFKTGAEAVAGAVRVARVETGRDQIVTCGYHGWLDTFSDAAGTPEAVRERRSSMAFNDVAAVDEVVGESIGAIVVEPVIDGPPDPSWVGAINGARARSGAVLILDEIKTGLRLGLRGAAARYGFDADLVVLGKALGNGFPVAAVCGPASLMNAATRTWISSTLATEFVSLAAANAVLQLYEREPVAAHLAAVGRRFEEGLEAIGRAYPDVVASVRGIPEFCYLECHDEKLSGRLAVGCARRGLLFKRNAYNFVSWAHSADVIDDVLQRVGDVVNDLANGQVT